MAVVVAEGQPQQGAELGLETWEIYPRSYAALTLGFVAAVLIYLCAVSYLKVITVNMCWPATILPAAPATT